MKNLVEKGSVPLSFSRQGLEPAQYVQLHREMLKSRIIEEKMLKLLRQGVVSKWFSGIGQEAISIGSTMALRPDEWIMPLHRNLGVFTSRGLDLKRLFAQLQGKGSGYSGGRERSFHFGVREAHIAGMISHLGPQLSLAAGVALAYKLRNEGKVSLAFTGDGGTSEGEFHEALNTAAVWKLPVIFIIENNGYGLSTPLNEQYACESLVDRAKGYGMEGYKVDGNNVLDVYKLVNRLASEMRKDNRPVLIEAETFRMRGHEEASGVKYVPTEILDTWAKRDPLQNYEDWLLAEGFDNAESIKAYRTDYSKQIQEALDIVIQEPEPELDEEREVKAVFYDYASQIQDGIAAEDTAEMSIKPIKANKKPMRLIDAIRDSLKGSMERHEGLVLMGQDIAEYGGVFKITDGFVELFGKGRVRNTTLCESAIVGIALGLSLEGMKGMVEMQFADFVTCGFNQIVNNLAKIHWRWGVPADVVIRMPTGADVGAGPFHSQSNEAWFYHVPGLKIVYPSSPSDAKGLLAMSIEDKNPVLFFEHKALYRRIEEPVYEDYYTIPIGKGKIVREGSDATVVTYGLGVEWMKQYCAEHPDEDIEVVDLRSLMPWDKDMVQASVLKTGRVLVLHEDNLTGGIGADIAAWIGERLFTSLDAPVMRLGSLDTPIPFNPNMEKKFLASSKLAHKMQELLRY